MNNIKFKDFFEWMEDNLLVEVKTKCLDCGQEGTASNFDWNAGKARCRGCGGSLEKLEPKKKVKPDSVKDPDVYRPSGYIRRAY